MQHTGLPRPSLSPGVGGRAAWLTAALLPPGEGEKLAGQVEEAGGEVSRIRKSHGCHLLPGFLSTDQNVSAGVSKLIKSAPVY